MHHREDVNLFPNLSAHDRRCYVNLSTRYCEALLGRAYHPDPTENQITLDMARQEMLTQMALEP